MKHVLLCIFFLGLGIAANAQAKISFSDAHVDFGKIKLGSKETQSISFKNTGDQPLTIKKISTTSDKITATGPTARIAPGRTGVIKIVFDAKQKGPVRRTVTVFSNAKNAPYKAIKITGMVIKKD